MNRPLTLRRVGWSTQLIEKASNDYETHKTETDNLRTSNYRSGTVNSRSFVGKVLLQIK